MKCEYCGVGEAKFSIASPNRFSLKETKRWNVCEGHTLLDHKFGDTAKELKSLKLTKSN